MAIKKYYVTVDEEGNTRWFKDARCTIRHRENGPAIEYTDGHKEWWQNGQPHRIGGPAIELTDGTKFWYQNGRLHREDGPAMEYPTGDNRWYINDKLLSEDEFNQAVKLL